MKRFSRSMILPVMSDCLGLNILCCYSEAKKVVVRTQCFVVLPFVVCKSAIIVECDKIVDPSGDAYPKVLPFCSKPVLQHPVFLPCKKDFHFGSSVQCTCAHYQGSFCKEKRAGYRFADSANIWRSPICCLGPRGPLNISCCALLKIVVIARTNDVTTEEILSRKKANLLIFLI
jgi:hypothetical protein